MIGPTPQGAGLFCVLSRGVAAKHLCGMLTEQYDRTVPFNVSVAEAATDIMQLLVKRQAAIARIDYEPHLKPLSKRNAQSHSGPHLMDRLASIQPKIDHTDNELRIELSYPAIILFPKHIESIEAELFCGSFCIGCRINEYID